MSAKIADFMPWLGVWTGAGETQAGHETLIRTDFAPAMDSGGLVMHFEAWDSKLEVLYHGVRAMLAPAPSGVLRALAYSTIHGPLVLELTPDDEGVMALAGESTAGNHLSVTFVQESANELLFTAFWRPPQLVSEDVLPRMTCKLKRGPAFKPPTPTFQARA